ncbi:hypothetical protein [Streptomyces cinnamoneus]|uniref:hypothetical protein n=1 Tax=Streptomyces cinnamoneus TaxID=53446 RepID=UPI003798D3A7
MPLAVTVILIILGVLLLITALIGSGVSRRLMTIPKMHRGPRIVLAALGALLLIAGGAMLTAGSGKHELTVEELKAHIPKDVKDNMRCEKGNSPPKGAVQMECSSSSGMPDGANYIMFPNVNDMQDYWMREYSPKDREGPDCDTADGYRKGSYVTYEDGSETIGDMVCAISAESGDNSGTFWASYTDRRYNIVVEANGKNADLFQDFVNWINETSKPTGDSPPKPATPTQTP